MDERILNWQNGGVDTATSTPVNVGGTNTFYVIDKQMANKAYLQPYYTAIFYVGDKWFTVPGTEELKVFSMTEAKTICQAHWVKYIDNAYFPQTLITTPPHQVLSTNQ